MKINDNQTQSETFATFDNGKLKLDIRISPDERNVWLSQLELAKLFETTKSNVSMHIKNIFNDGELLDSVVQKSLTTQSVYPALVKKSLQNELKKIKFI